MTYQQAEYFFNIHHPISNALPNTYTRKARRSHTREARSAQNAQKVLISINKNEICSRFLTLGMRENLKILQFIADPVRLYKLSKFYSITEFNENNAFHPNNALAADVRHIFQGWQGELGGGRGGGVGVGDADDIGVGGNNNREIEK